MFRQILKYLPKYNANLIFNKPINDLTNICLLTAKSTSFHINCACYGYTQANPDAEKEFLVKLKNDPDTFGHQELEEHADPGDLQEEEYLREHPLSFQKLSTKQYADIIKSYIKKRKIKEAIDIVEVQMIKEDKVQPENYIYNLLIGACGRVGYTKKAFSLYNEMKRRALNITPGTYTALFNACANSPWPTTDGLSRATHLLDTIREKMYLPNITNYNAMIKAFGRAGDLTTAFSFVDEMSARKLGIQDDTLNFLLQACISDKEAGFRHALLVWRKLIEKRIKPSLYTYNLMLRCIRDCGLGDIDTTKDVIAKLLSASKQNAHLLESDSKQLIINANELTLNNKGLMNKPNLMAPIPQLGNILSLSKVVRAEDRLLLVGGCMEFLQNMIDNNCQPDIKTFTQLLDNIPATKVAEEDLLKALCHNKVKPDIDFFNMLIKKRSSRFDYESGKEVLTMLKEARQRPNLITYGVLAIGCTTPGEAVSLIEEMAQAKYRMNIEILGAMLTQACHHNNFQYVVYLMEMCISEAINPSPKFMQNLEEFKKKSKKISNDQNNPILKSGTFQKGYKMFKVRYSEWCKEVKVEAEDVHPWQQYRQTSNTDTLHYKDKENTTRFKPVHTSLFRHKTTVRNVKTKYKR